MSLPAYPDYKESGVPWIGDVPSHWDVIRFKWLIERNDGGVWGNDPDEIDDTIVLRSTEQTIDGYWKIKEPAERKLTEKERNSALLAEGDLLITKSSGSALHIGKATLVDMHVAELKACYSNFMQRLRVNCKIRPNIVWYILNNELARGQMGLLSSSTTGLANLTGAVIGNLLLALPPLSEQTAITTFLDRETGKIDALIAEQEKLLTLLAEKRQATISHAVTRGLNPDVPMKDSGVAWLGEVPAHWSTGALGYLCSIETGATPDRGNLRYWGGTIPWIKTGEINWLPISGAEECISEEGVANSATRLAKPNTLLMAMYGQGVTRGRVALLEIEAAYNQACAAMFFGPRILPMFALYFFMAAYSYIRDSGNETSQMNLNASLVAKFKITIPPIIEQTKIIAFLTREITKFDRLKAEAENAIALLKERRSALISAAVTGKIDVRNAVGKGQPT